MTETWTIRRGVRLMLAIVLVIVLGIPILAQEGRASSHAEGVASGDERIIEFLQTAYMGDHTVSIAYRTSPLLYEKSVITGVSAREGDFEMPGFDLPDTD